MKYQGFSQTLLLTPMNKAFETPTVTPHTGVWIETSYKPERVGLMLVTPQTGLPQRGRCGLKRNRSY